MSNDPTPEDEMPPELLRRIHQVLRDNVAEQPAELRGPLMRALEDGHSVTVRAHIVGGITFVYATAQLDNGQTATQELPGSLFGLFADSDGTIGWVAFE